MIDFNGAKLTGDILSVESEFGTAKFHVNENWLDTFEEEDMAEAAIFFLEELREAIEGEQFRRFADAPDDNSIAVTSPRTAAELAEARKTDRFTDLVESLGDENALKFCAAFVEQVYA